VAAHSEEEEVALGEFVAFVVVIDVLFSMEDNPITQRVNLWVSMPLLEATTYFSIDGLAVWES